MSYKKKAKFKGIGIGREVDIWKWKNEELVFHFCIFSERNKAVRSAASEVERENVGSLRIEEVSNHCLRDSVDLRRAGGLLDSTERQPHTCDHFKL